MRFIDATLIVLVISGLAYLVMLVAALKQPGNRDSHLYLLPVMLVSALVWTVLQVLHRLQALTLIVGFDLFILERIALYFLLVDALVFYQLTRQFLRLSIRKPYGWLVGGISLVVAIVLYENLLNLRDVFFSGNGFVVLRWLVAFSVLVLGWSLLMIGSIWLTLRNDGNRTSPLHRNRAKYWSLAVALATAGAGFVLARLTLLGNLLYVLAAGTSVYALLTFQLPDLRQGMRRASSFMIMTLMTLAVYTGSFYLIEQFGKSISGYSPLAAGVILAAVLALLFNPLLNIVQRFINRLISGTRYDSGQTLGEYSMSISNILDIEMLATVAIGLIAETLEITQGALVIVHYEGEEWLPQEITDGGTYHLRAISGFGSDLSLGHEMPSGKLSAKNPVAYYLSRKHHPLTQYDIDLLPRFHDMEPSERDWINSLKMDVYVPIYAKESWIGILALGPKSSGDRYFDEDLVFLQTLADQTAVALENARLFDDLKQRNADNERLNSELKTANEELARLDHAKSDFINIASHELRTPLTQMLGYNDILSEMIKGNNMQPSVGLQMTESVRKAARRLEEIVDTMFDVSKLDTNTLDLMRMQLSIASVITVAVDTWTKGIETRKMSVSVRGLASLPMIKADNKRLVQVFSQLVQNAIKSTPDGGQIRITGRMVEAQNNGIEANCYVEIVVADSGIGIAKDDLERIFEKFYRVGNVLLHSTGDTKFKGAGPGLGLTITRGIVEAHGGRIWAESPGHDEETFPGAQFHVLLPLE